MIRLGIYRTGSNMILTRTRHKSTQSYMYFLTVLPTEIHLPIGYKAGKCKAQGLSSEQLNKPSRDSNTVIIILKQ